MTRKRTNTQMFALSGRPPGTLDVGGGRYRLVRVFKHDFYAATCLYERLGGPAETLPRIVVKLYRTQPFFGLPMAWMGQFLRDHEEGIYAALADVPGVPQWLGRVGRNGYALEYIDGRPLDHVKRPPAGFFDALRAIFDAIHARGVCYCDGNKRSNILIREDGAPFLIDYQIAFRRRDDLPRPFRGIWRRVIEYFQRRDLYHLYKHKRRMARDELTDEELRLSRGRGLLHTIHRGLTDPYRYLRRRLLGRQYRKGALVSPTADLEDHYQPEKATWRKA